MWLLDMWLHRSLTFLFLYLCATVVLAEPPTRSISHVSVRLPAPSTDSDQVRFPLRAYHGCYQWQTWNRSLLYIEQVSDPHPSGHCSSTVILIPLQQGSTKVVAQDGPETLSCDVFVAPLKLLQVLTTTRTIAVDDLHVVTAQAFDHQENVFTGLHGLRFRWEVYPIHSGLGAQAIVHLLPPESAETTLAPLHERQDYSLPSGADGMRLDGESVVVKGLQPGRVTLDLSIDSMGLHAKSVELNIVDHLEIVPPFTPHSSLVLMVNEVTPVHFHLWRRRQGQWAVIDTKKEGFAWSISRHQIASIDQLDGKFHSFAPGEVTVSVKDQHFEANAAQQLVHLVHPVHFILKFHLISGRPSTSGAPPVPATPFTTQQTHILANAQYIVELQVYDSLLRRLYIPQLCPFSLSSLSTPVVYAKAAAKRLDEASLAAAQISNNYSAPDNFLQLNTLAHGQLQISACLPKGSDAVLLHDVGVEGRNCVLLARVKVSVDEPLTIQHETADRFNGDGVIYLPLEKDIQQRYTLKVRGGSGRYLLYTPTNNFFEVAEGTTIRTKHQTGEGVLFVIDELNPDNNLTLTVVVSIPATLEIAPGPRDAPVGSKLEVELLLRDSRGKAFTMFDMLPLTWTLMHPEVFAQQHTPTQVNRLQALKPGSTHLEVTGPHELIAQTFIAAFPPLSANIDLDPFLVVPGSALSFDLHGGPSKIHTYASEVSTEVQLEGQGIAKAELNENGQVTVICGTQLEQRQLKVIRRHQSSVSGATATDYIFECLVMCAVPKAMRVAPAARRGVAVGERVNSYNIYMREPDEELIANAVFTDNSGRQFAAHGALDLRWTISDPATALLTSPAAYSYARLALQQPGDLIIRAECLGYNGYRKDGPKFVASVLLVVLTSLTVTPEKSLLWGSPVLFQTIAVTGGSGRYTYTHPPSSLVQVTEKRGGGGVNVRWVGTEKLPQDIVLKVQDVVYDYATASVSLHVTDVQQLQPSVTHLAIQLGHSEMVQFAALDETGASFPPEQCSLMSPIVTCSGRAVEVSDRGGCNFEVRALHTGHSTMHVAITNAASHAIRTSVHIVVYAQEVIATHEIALRSGVQFELGFIGGLPGAQRSSPVFSTARSAVASVNSQGMVTAGRPGTTELQVSWQAGDRALRETVEVTVVDALIGARVNTADGKRTVQVGEVFSVTAVGEALLPDLSGKKVLLSPLFYLRPGTTCQWSVRHGVLEIIPTANVCEALFRANAKGASQVAVTISDGAQAFDATLDILAISQTIPQGALLLPSFTSYPLPFNGVTYTATQADGGVSGVLLAASMLETEKPTSAVLRATYDNEDKSRAIAINVASPHQLVVSTLLSDDCSCPRLSQTHGGIVLVAGSSGLLSVALLDDQGNSFDYFSEDDLKVISNRPSVAKGIVQHNGGGLPQVAVSALHVGHALLEISFVTKPQQHGNWATSPAYPVRGFSPQSTAPLPLVVMASWSVWVVEKTISMKVPSGIVAEFPKKGQAAGTVISYDISSCVPNANLVTISKNPGGCSLIYSDAALSYHVNLSAQTVGVARFLHRSLVSVSPMNDGLYTAKVPVVLMDDQSEPIDSYFHAPLHHHLASLLKQEPSPALVQKEGLLQVGIPSDLSCSLQGGDVLQPSSEPGFRTDIIAQYGQLYCIVYAVIPPGTQLNATHFSIPYEVVLSWSGRPTDVLSLRVIPSDCTTGASGWSLRWWLTMAFTLLALYLGYRILWPVLLVVNDPHGFYGARESPWARTPGTAPRRAPMLVPRDTTLAAPDPPVTAKSQFNPFGAPSAGITTGQGMPTWANPNVPPRPYGFH